ncbi:MAG: STAS domain-containing protein [Spirochaetaceae bacterium]
MDRGRYYFAEKDDITYIKMVGNLKYTTSSGFDRFVDNLVERGFENLVIDLSEATYIDSTNLGLIAKLAEESRKDGRKHVSIISTCDDINEILESVRFNRLFTIVKSVEDASEKLCGVEGQELEDVETCKREDLQMLLKAHKALIEAHQDNVPQFKDVVELLEQEEEREHRD